MPCHHARERYFDEYIAAASIVGDVEPSLWHVRPRQAQTMWQQDEYRMIQRRAAAAGVETRIGNHTLQGCGRMLNGT